MGEGDENMNTVFGTVFYKLAYDYIEEFINSINNQLDKDFRVLIINDDIERRQLEALLSKCVFQYEIIEYENTFSPAGLRIMLLIEAIKRDVDLLIIGDADDVFSENRVGLIKKYADNDINCTFLYNDILTLTGEKVFPQLPKRIKRIEDICDYNFLGMSNTAIKINKLTFDKVYSFFEGDQPIFDWYLYSRLLIDGAKGKYVEGAITFYRYHENNLVGDQDANKEIIKREIEVKKRHYYSLANHSLIMKRRAIEYTEGRFKIVKPQNPHYWWDYTKGEWKV